MKKDKKDKFDTAAGKKEENTVYLFYSAAAEMFGTVAAVVSDGKGGTKEIVYTLYSNNKSAPEYGWKDKQLVWQGKKSEIISYRPSRPIDLRMIHWVPSNWQNNLSLSDISISDPGKERLKKEFFKCYVGKNGLNDAFWSMMKDDTWLTEDQQRKLGFDLKGPLKPPKNKRS